MFLNSNTAERTATAAAVAIYQSEQVAATVARSWTAAPQQDSDGNAAPFLGSTLSLGLCHLQPIRVPNVVTVALVVACYITCTVAIDAFTNIFPSTFIA
jgi:hypothetical protein